MNRFAKAMATRTDDELIAVLTDPADDWEPDAIDAAREEIAERGLSLEYQQSARERQVRVRETATSSLPGRTRLLAFVLGTTFFISAVVVFGYYRKRGEYQRAKEFLAWAAFGWGIAIIVIVLMPCR